MSAAGKTVKLSGLSCEKLYRFGFFLSFVMQMDMLKREGIPVFSASDRTSVQILFSGLLGTIYG